MMAGRNAVARGAVDKDGNIPSAWRWADEGQKFLQEKFEGTGLSFTTALSGKYNEYVELCVWRENELSQRINLLFKVRELIEYFVSDVTVAKITMVM